MEKLYVIEWWYIREPHEKNYDTRQMPYEECAEICTDMNTRYKGVLLHQPKEIPQVSKTLEKLADKIIDASSRMPLSEIKPFGIDQWTEEEQTKINEVITSGLDTSL